MKRTFLLAILFVCTACYSAAKDYKITSPDNKITLTVTVSKEISWSAAFEGKELINSSKIAMVLANGKVLGENEKVRKAGVSKLNEIIIPVVANKKSEITDNCNILTISFDPAFHFSSELIMMASHTGLKLLKEDLTVKNEISELIFLPVHTHGILWKPVLCRITKGHLSIRHSIQ